MAKRRKTISLSAVKWPLIILLTLAILIGSIVYACHFIGGCILNADYFKVKIISIDPALQSISRRDLKYVLGNNILFLDLKAIEKDLLRKYPFVSQLKIVKHFPNQISIEAKQRFAVLQIKGSRGYYVVDTSGVVMAIASEQNPALPVALGLDYPGRLVLGKTLSTRKTDWALRIAAVFSMIPELSSYPLASVDVGNLFKIELTLTNNLRVIMDDERVEERLTVLGKMLSRGNLNLSRIKYIDLRFKEPVLGTK